MLKKSLQKALIDPFVKQFKQKIEKVMVDGELADLTRRNIEAVLNMLLKVTVY